MWPHYPNHNSQLNGVTRRVLAKKGDIKAAVFVIHGSKDPVAPKADRDALEAEMDGAGANHAAPLARTSPLRHPLTMRHHP